jgi:hypothetical protein
MGKRGQIDLSFGLIFSVILIIAFLGFAIYAIINFLGMQQKIQVSTFIKDLQNDVDVFWKSTQSVDTITYSLPTKIEKVCFINTALPKRGTDAGIYEELERRLGKDSNLIFYPLGSSKALYSANIEHIDLTNMTKTKNPLCFVNKNGKTNITLEQEFGGSNLVELR